jgi:hypothetical protein
MAVPCWRACVARRKRMAAGSNGTPGAQTVPPWLEIIEGASNILLIAPHGGRAGPAARRRINPKINDLHTAEITRTLAASLDAAALINAAMDRNDIDLNRIGQIVERAPWLLDAIAERVERIVARKGRAAILLIHGWNIIEPRADFGLGARLRDGKLVATSSAHVSAGDEFIDRVVVPLGERLSRGGILATFGFRYPAGGLHNLLQAFTPRHATSPHRSLRRLAELASRRLIDALQIELSVAVRMPGTLRRTALDAMVDAFARASAEPRARPKASIPVVRVAEPRPAHTGVVPQTQRLKPAPLIPARVGLEFFDQSTRIGAMASFDLGPGAVGARIMLLLDAHRVALFTSEGKVRRDGDVLALGPLSLCADSNNIVELRFRGPAVIVPDAGAYLSIERALASGRLEESLEVVARLELDTPLDLGAILEPRPPEQPAEWSPTFGAIAGKVAFDGTTRELRAVGRAGLSFTGVGPSHFVSRRMLWASFSDNGAPTALEARVIARDDKSDYRSARVLDRPGWMPCDVAQFELDTAAPHLAPERIAATLCFEGRGPAEIVGEVQNFVPLSRPGPAQTRILTTLGFATFTMGDSHGAGMFEYSRRALPIIADRASKDMEEE